LITLSLLAVEVVLVTVTHFQEAGVLGAIVLVGTLRLVAAERQAKLGSPQPLLITQLQLAQVEPLVRRQLLVMAGTGLTQSLDQSQALVAVAAVGIQELVYLVDQAVVLVKNLLVRRRRVQPTKVLLGGWHQILAKVLDQAAVAQGQLV
tara:strand:+ start:33 stop:479 length:447 start_codon:yes stop_codon:yes gene_type:complete